TVIVDWDNDIYGGVTIDWGDGESEIFNAAEGSVSHTYAAPGEYVIRVTATDHPERTVTIPVSIGP
ncbi:MAG TPA: PKD domain-containing protein, partial [Natronosporangium sp.]|nr:PKD domain-containing protein [Natronosporangium sp.]